MIYPIYNRSIVYEQLLGLNSEHIMFCFLSQCNTWSFSNTVQLPEVYPTSFVAPSLKIKAYVCTANVIPLQQC